MTSFVKAVSKDLGKENIRVNSVCIGLVRSDQIERKWRNEAPTAPRLVTGKAMSSGFLNPKRISKMPESFIPIYGSIFMPS